MVLVKLQVTSPVMKTYKKIKYICTEAKSHNIDLIVFPEMSMGVIDRSNTPNILSSNYKQFISKIKEISKETQIDIIATAWEPDKNKRGTYNSTIFIQRDGSHTILYRKLHLFNSLGFNESSLVLPGYNLPKIIEYKGFKLSVSICYDLRFPEIYRYQAVRKTDISIVCAAWYMGKHKEEHLTCLTKARAIENTMYIVLSNLCGDNFCGRSSIFDPFGIQICDAGEDEGLIYGYIRKNRLEKNKKNFAMS